MNNFLLQKLLCGTSIKKVPLKNLLNNRTYATLSTSTTHHHEKSQSREEPPKWITIYKFPYIRLAASVAKIRKFQYIVTCVAPPVTYAFEHFNLVPDYSTVLAFSLSVSLSITLTLCSLVVRRLIGFLYVDSERKNARIGYLTFGGTREDKIIQIEDLKTLSETKKFKFQPFQTVATYTDTTKYKLMDQDGVIRRDEYEFLFGKQ